MNFLLYVKRYVVGALNTNCYILTESQSNVSILIDSGEICPTLEHDVKAVNLKMILLTHGHFDHICSAEYIRNITGAKIGISTKEKEFLLRKDLNLSAVFREYDIKPFKPDICFKENGSVISFGDYCIKVLSTPGHTCGSVCYLVDRYIFSGDTIFKGEIGRTDFPTGSISDINKSLKKLYSLGKNYIICPGHGDYTSVYNEISKN